MSAKYPALVLLCLLLAIPAWAQKGAGRQARPDQGMAQLMGEIAVLDRLVALQFTDAQIEMIQGAFGAAEKAADKTPEQQMQQKLLAMRRRLLEGTPLVATDRATLREATRLFGRSGQTARRAAIANLTPLAQAVWEILTTSQKEILLGGTVPQAAADPTKTAKLAPRLLLQRLSQLRQADETPWRAERDRLAAAISEYAGPAESAQRHNCAQMFIEYCDRVRRLSDADFVRQQDELVASLAALLPPGASMHVILFSDQPALVQAALEASVINVRAPMLLRELLQARRNACATCR